MADAVATQLTGLLEVTLWPVIFGPGSLTLDVLLAECRRNDFAVLVLTPDDLTISRDKSDPSARDNVIFEAGMFMGVLGRERTFLVVDKDKDIHRPSDLYGINLVEYKSNRSNRSLSGAVDEACAKIRVAVRDLGAVAERSPLPMGVNEASDVVSVPIQTLLPYEVMISNKAYHAFLDTWKDEASSWQVHAWADYHGGKNQHWRIHSLADGNAIITSVESSQALDAYHDAGWHLHLWPYHGHENQQWKIERQSDHTYKISRPNTNLCLTTVKEDAEIHVRMLDWDGSDHQRWWINPISAP